MTEEATEHRRNEEDKDSNYSAGGGREEELSITDHAVRRYILAHCAILSIEIANDADKRDIKCAHLTSICLQLNNRKKEAHVLYCRHLKWPTIRGMLS